ncbi:MAG TPA: bifunctional 23S rRNA (guanine(2069)-N(7))-methyltransferase RlmK/23S rRNA (guanine(2445)-N(2))-methyltransferase RlmL [Polyangiales bacterium]|nr:bifunctional 23S rRNA (guanine(2069)-N(7))-methyltransferase RlmK/23S rRNA (guanine(2445)-N(2))-methyltransferase RlmL [Polyangiales bacterium]
MQLTAVAARGVEAVLGRELIALGAQNVVPGRGAVTFEGELELAYRACLWLRSASRVLVPLARFATGGPDELYEGVRTIAWFEHLSETGTLSVDCAASSEVDVHTRFLSQKTKDAICDQLRERTGSRPSVDRDQPDVRVHVHVGGQHTTVGLDLGGGAMHRRNYRPRATAAPLKETLAAAVLLIARWDERAARGEPLFDPLCGSGTLPVEAALIAGDVAPGLHRRHHGVLGWRGHDRALWQRLWREAEQRARDGRTRIPPIFACDASAEAVAATREAAASAGVSEHVRCERVALADSAAPPDVPPGIVVANPPYGERLGNTSELLPLYEQLGDSLRRKFPGWTAYLLTGSPALAKHVGLRASQRYPLYNGAIDCRLLEYPIDATAVQSEKPPGWRKPSAEAGAFANRLRKNLKTMGRWAEQRGVECYRLYDADIPEYNVAVDRYGARVVVQEYAAPRSIDAAVALRRLRDALLVVAEALEVPRDEVVLKVRRRQVQGGQYERRDAQADEQAKLVVSEGGLQFEVDLGQHIDTGLFPEQRELRALLAREAEGKAVLNLFAYTCAASVSCAAAGARSVTSVDLSASYLTWGKRNFALNGLSEKSGRGLKLVQQFAQQDCGEFLERTRERYDLIYLNPPSYSRSHRMHEDFEIKRDHVALIEAALRALAPDGTLYFATHARGFELAEELRSRHKVEDISARVVPRDYARSPFQAFRISS